MPAKGAAVLVTGATGGIGYFTAEQLAARGHRVLLCARDWGRARAATRAIRSQVPGADLGVVPLDLADLSSVRAAAEGLAAGERLAAVVANAAVVSYGLRPAAPQLTADGFELHLGTAYLGHYALLARLLATLEGWGTRLVHVGSLSHRLPLGRAPWATVTRPRREPSFVSYARSKVAVALLALELAARFRRRRSAAASVLTHPGLAVDVLTPERDGIPASQPTDVQAFSRLVVRGMHGKDGGADVLVHAACAAEVRNGQLWGPDGRGQLSGRPCQLPAPRIRGADRLTAELLRVSAEVSGVGLA